MHAGQDSAPIGTCSRLRYRRNGLAACQRYQRLRRATDAEHGSENAPPQRMDHRDIAAVILLERHGCFTQ